MNRPARRLMILALAGTVIILTTIVFQMTQTFYKDFLRGRSLLEKGRYQEALPYYQRAHEKHPIHSQVCEGLLVIYEKLHQQVLAVELLKQMAAEAPADLILQERLADAYYSMKNFAETEALYRKILSYKKNTPLLEKLARVLVWQKKYQEACPLLKELRTIKPEDGELVEFSADVTAWAKNYDDAAALYAEALRFFPDRHQLLIKRADQLRYAGHNEEALKIYEHDSRESVK